MSEKKNNVEGKDKKLIIVILIVLAVVISFILALFLSNILYGTKVNSDNDIEEKTTNESDKDNKIDSKTESNDKKVERILKSDPIQYKISNSLDLPAGWPYEVQYNDISEKETVQYIFDSCLVKEMPTVYFSIENSKLMIEGYYDQPYYFDSISPVKQFIIRNYQSNTSRYLVILTESGDVYIGKLFDVCTVGGETVLSPEELENSLQKVTLDNKIDSMKSVTSFDVSMIALYSGETTLYLNFN